jgi:hypothetical protein
MSANGNKPVHLWQRSVGILAADPKDFPAGDGVRRTGGGAP